MTRRSYTDEQLTEAVRTNISWGGVLRQLGLHPGGGTYTHLRGLAIKQGLDTSHFKGQGWNKGLRLQQTYGRKLEDYLVLDGPPIGSHALKLRLVRNGKEWKCASCGITTWNDKPAPIELNHINGNNRDNRPENLEFLCANCHAQTDTYCGKNRRF